MQKAVKIFCTIALLWIVFVSTVNRLKYPDKSETRLFLDIPKNTVLKFESEGE